MNYKLKFTLVSLLVVAAVLLLFGGQSFVIAIFSRILAVAIAAMGFNVLLGITGQISIGHGAFMAVGAYTTAILSTRLGLPFAVSILPAILFSAILGIVIGLPALRLKGYYLAIATLAFGVVVEQLIASMRVLGGHDGIRNIPGFFDSDIGTFLVVAGFYILLGLIAYRILESPMGRRFRMVRDSEVASRSYGIDVSRTKLASFILSAIYGGVAGGLYAHTVGFIIPANFGLVLSLNILAIVIIGGLGSVQGGLIGSTIIVGLPFIFSRGFGTFLGIIVGGLLIVFVLFFPKGLAYGLFLGYSKYFQRPLIAVKNAFLRKKDLGGKTVEVDGVPLFYLERGSAEEATIVYVHGNTGCNLWFERVMEVPGYRTLAVDLPNFGRSGRIDEADIDRYADYLAGFLEKVAPDRPLLVGHSLGGAVCQSLVSRRPQLVSRLMLVDSAPPEGLVTPEEHYGAIELYRTSRALMRKGLAAVTPAMKDSRFLSRLADNAMLMNPIAFVGNARALERFDVEGRTAAFTQPVLVVVGRKDMIVTMDMAKRTAAGFPAARLEVLDHVGHSVMVEDPPTFLRLLGDFARA